MSRVKGFFLSENDKGELKLDLVKAVCTAAVSFFVLWAIWVTTQCYDVATNKNLIASTGVSLEKSNASNDAAIKKLDGEMGNKFDRTNQILHTRITKVDDKYDAKMTDLNNLLMQTNTLIVEMLIQKNKEVQLKKQEVEMQQQQQQAPRWPMSPHNGDNR